MSNNLTAQQMNNVYFADQIQRDAKMEEVEPLTILYELYDPAERTAEENARIMAEYTEGAALLETHTITYHRGTRSTIRPTPGPNQIVVDAGYIANSEAYMLVSIAPLS